MKLRKILNKHTNAHRYFSFDSLLSNLGLYNHKLKQTDRQEQPPSSPRVQLPSAADKHGQSCDEAWTRQDTVN